MYFPKKRLKPKRNPEVHDRSTGGRMLLYLVQLKVPTTEFNKGSISIKD